ncbi:hypothetical protein ABEB36_002726 [Hypothenemus hampei]|uniref:Serpin domain-containing protein n=1 Tax=Hypothenemus hampei TaxID=57062 RepID=A0ABD1F8K5_HYPHA
MHTHLLLPFAGSVFIWFFSRMVIVLGYDESSWQPVLYDYYHIDLGELGGNQDQGNPEFKGFTSKIPAPRDAIVNVINDLGIKLLSIHNERNENNIAISPYGAFSVLAALTEGLEGESAQEIMRTARIPLDKEMIRVGLRDIHRHLKSYFIPEEGFLAGLTLNLNNITLKKEYEKVLRFYGFDYGSFNNALLPDPPTTKKPTDGTTPLETGFGVAADTTATPQGKSTETVTEASTTILPSSSSTLAPTTTTTLAEPTTTIESKEEVTTPSEASTTPEKTVSLETTTVESTTVEEISTEISPLATTSTTLPETTNAPEVTVVETFESTESLGEKNEDGTTTVSKDKGTAKITTVTAMTNSRTENGFTTTKLRKTTSEFSSKSSLDAETASSNLEIVTEKGSTLPMTTMNSEISTKSTIMTGNTVRTTRDVMLILNTDKQITSLEPELTTQSTEKSVTADSINTLENSSVETTTVDDVMRTISSETSTGDEYENTSDSIESDPGYEEEDNLETTTSQSVLVETTTNFKDSAMFSSNSDMTYNYDAAPVPVYDENMITNNDATSEKTIDVVNEERKKRSIVDYVIARIYDDRPAFMTPPPQRTLYVPKEMPTFAVYGKYRESGVSFMNYDTVLPYAFLPNLSALALSFPLDSTKYYLLLLLPLRDDGIDQLICDLRLYGNLGYIIRNLRLTRVVATIPSFTLKGYVTLTPTLQRLGIRRIFEPRQADFSPMTNASDIYVTNIEQAVTVTIRNYLDPSADRYKNFMQYPPVHFKADHPFLYFVVDSELHVALMVGKVINPLNSRIA